MHTMTTDIASLPVTAAKMLAVEILLADPESLGRRRARKLPLYPARKAQRDNMSNQTEDLESRLAHLAHLEARIEMAMNCCQV